MDVMDALLLCGVAMLLAGAGMGAATLLVFRRRGIRRVWAFLKGRSYLDAAKVTPPAEGNVLSRVRRGTSGLHQADKESSISNNAEFLIEQKHIGYNHMQPEDAAAASADAPGEVVRRNSGIGFEVTRSVMSAGTDRAIAIDHRS